MGIKVKNTQVEFWAAAAEQHQYGSIRGGGSVQMGSGEASADGLSKAEPRRLRLKTLSKVKSLCERAAFCLAC